MRKGSTQGLPTLSVVIAALTFLPPAAAAEGETVSPELKASVTNRAVSLLRANYVFPEALDGLGEAMERLEQTRAFREATSAEEFASIVSGALREFVRDEHLVLRYVGGVAGNSSSVMTRDEFLNLARQDNYGFTSARILEGNVGYLQLGEFLFQASLSGPTLTAAMNFIAGADALVLDLRDCHGGHTSVPPVLLSYLFEEPTLVAWSYSRVEDRTEQVWTSPWVPGGRFGGHKPVRVLVGPETFSAGEALAWHLQTLGRARVVGETTRGGAHPGRFFDIEGGFNMFISTEAVYDPLTGESWEGSGVRPDTVTPTEDALTVAHRDLLEKLLERAARDPRRKEQGDQIREILEGFDRDS